MKRNQFITFISIISIIGIFIIISISFFLKKRENKKVSSIKCIKCMRVHFKSPKGKERTSQPSLKMRDYAQPSSQIATLLKHFA